MQVLWNTIENNKFLYSDVLGYCILGEHFSISSFILLPFYFLFGSEPKILLYVQALIVTAGGILIYLISKERLNNRPLALLFCLSYFLYPYTSNVIFNPFGYNELCLAIVGILALFYSLNKNKYWYIVILLFCLSIREEMSLLTFMVGMYLLLGLKRKALGIITIVISVLWSVFCLYVIIPYFRGEAYPFFWIRYGSLGKDLFDCIKNILIYPEIVIDKLLIANKLIAVVLLFLPVGCLCLLSAKILIIIPYLLLQLVSDWSTQYYLLAQYSAPIISVVFISAIDGLQKFNKYKWLNWVFLWTSSICFALFYQPPLVAIYNNAEGYSIKEHTRLMLLRFELSKAEKYFKENKEKIRRMIPEDSSLSCQNNLASYFACRDKIYEFPD